MRLSTVKFTALSSFGFNFFLGLFASFLLIGCGSESKIAIAAGDSYSFALDGDGNVYTAGTNYYGQLVSNCEFYVNCKVFAKVSSLKNKNITAMSAGSHHSFAIEGNGKVYGSGDNDNGQLGLGDTKDRPSFLEIPSLNSKNIIAVAAGDNHSLALGNDGRVYGAGWNSYGGLGLGDATNRNTFTAILSLEGKNIVAVAAGGDSSFALGSDGKVYAAGSNSHGQLGLGNTNYQYSFTVIPSLNDIVSITAGSSHLIAIDSIGKVYIAGWNHNGQLGLGDNNDRHTFTEVSSLNGKNIVAVAAGNFYSIALDIDGKVYTTGWNYSGELGLGDTNDRNVFTEVSSFNGKNITAIVAGYYHSFAIDNEDKVYAVGSNYYGQLGLGDRKDRSTFTEITR